MTAPPVPMSGPDTLLLGGDLVGALAAGELQLHYLPVVHLGTGVGVGVEAAVRWFTPRRGVMTDGDLVAVAERSGMGTPLGEATLRAACRDAAVRTDLAGDARPALRVAVNATPGMLVATGRFGIVPTVERSLVAAGLDPSYLEIEVDESAVARCVDAAAVAFDQLRRLGVRVVLDQFGSEFGALTLMSRLPLDGVKISALVVAGLGAGTLALDTLHGAVGVAGDVGLTVAAAGITTRDQLRAVREAGVTLGQGRIFSEAVPIGAIDRMLGLETAEEYRAAWAEAAATAAGYGYRLGDLPRVDDVS